MVLKEQVLLQARGVDAEEPKPSSHEGGGVSRTGAKMELARNAICPICGHANGYGRTCRVCKNPVVLKENDCQDVVFVGMDDGYHSWYSPPTSYHERYRCANYETACASCVHEPAHDIFCHAGKVDMWRLRRVLGNGTVVCVYKDWGERV